MSSYWQLCCGVDSLALTDDTRGAIANLVVLALAELNEELCDLMLEFHAVHDGRSIVGYLNISVGTDQDFVQSSRTETGLENGRNRLGRRDVVLDGLNAMGARLFALLSDDDERSPVLILGIGYLWLGHCC